jgi:glucose dehydrogenase
MGAVVREGWGVMGAVVSRSMLGWVSTWIMTSRCGIRLMLDWLLLLPWFSRGAVRPRALLSSSSISLFLLISLSISLSFFQCHSFSLSLSLSPLSLSL